MTFLPLDLTNPDSIENVLSHIDYTMQYGEDEEPKEVGASPVCACLPATLFGFIEGQAWIAFLSFMEQVGKADCVFSFLFTSFLWPHSGRRHIRIRPR